MVHVKPLDILKKSAVTDIVTANCIYCGMWQHFIVLMFSFFNPSKKTFGTCLREEFYCNGDLQIVLKPHCCIK